MCPSRSPLASFAIFSVFGTSGRFIIYAHTPCYMFEQALNQDFSTGMLSFIPISPVARHYVPVLRHSEWIRAQIPCSVHFEHLVASDPFC
ncbi:hypothetical protein B0H11DRAFT_2021262, partial [Mycena galericulata]